MKEGGGDDEDFNPDWDDDDDEATKLHKRLLEAEVDEDVSPEVQQELGKILFKKKTVTTGGITRQYVATTAETTRTIKRLLQRRRDYMENHDLHDGPPASSDAAQLADGRYLFNHMDRQGVMNDWKEEFHHTPDQLQQQKRDSWKPMPNERRIARNGNKYTLRQFIDWYGDEQGPQYWEEATVDDDHGLDKEHDFGPNRDAVRKGKHSRFARHLQLEAGSKTMAELIIYAGRFDPEFLNRVHEAQYQSGASQPASAHQQGLKRVAATAKLNYRETCRLHRKLNEGKVAEEHLAWWQRDNLEKFMNGSLLQETNDAVAAYGHGTLRRVDGESLEIGGSTGGVTRFLLDGFTEPDVHTFLANQ